MTREFLDIFFFKTQVTGPGFLSFSFLWAGSEGSAGTHLLGEMFQNLLPRPQLTCICLAESWGIILGMHFEGQQKWRREKSRQTYRVLSCDDE